MVNPVPGYGITTPYKATGKYWSLGWHTGVDIAGGQANRTIVSATPGKVIAANVYDSSYGYKVIIRWDNKYDVWYCHMPKDAAKVKIGQTVKAGQEIGRTGSTGSVTGPHLHMELRHKGAGFAPSSFLDHSIAINYTEDWFAMATEAQLRKIIREEIERLVSIDNVPVYPPTRTPEQIEKDPTAKWGSVLGSTLSKVTEILDIVKKDDPKPEPTPKA